MKRVYVLPRTFPLPKSLVRKLLSFKLIRVLFIPPKVHYIDVAIRYYAIDAPIPRVLRHLYVFIYKLIHKLFRRYLFVEVLEK